MNGNGVGSNITDCDIISNVAGIGGIGGTGQLGSAVTPGATGSQFTGSCSPQGKGGDGGSGGAGGAGGNGQPGASGVTAEIILNGTAPTYTAHGAGTSIVTGINNPPIFNLPAQVVISADNISCTHRNDVLSSTTSATWATGAGATVPSGSGTSITTQYNTVGRKDIGFNSSTYTGFVYIAIDQNSFIPVIQSSAPVLHTDTFWVCQGSNANFTLQIASADSFQWNFGGATTPNTYLGGSAVQNLNGLSFNTAGTFLIQGRILTSCCGWSPWDTAYILVEPVSTITYTGPTSFCAGDSVHIILTGTASSYSWAPPQGVSNPAGSNVYIAPQQTTTYLATAYSPRGLCNADTSITVTKIIPATLTFTTVPAACGPSGSAFVTPAPTGTYTYSWNNTSGPTTGASISSQPSGTYTVTVTPQGTTCSVSASTSIGTNGGVQAYIVKTIQPQCFGQCNGQVKVKAIGGTGPFVYHWSPGPTGALDSLLNICAGTYNVTITDANNCSSSTSVALTAPPLLVAVVLDSVSPRCPGQCTGYAFADGQGGTGPYSFAWSNGSNAQKDTLLCAARYTLGIVDQHGCTATTAVNITTPPLMTIAFATVNDSCFGLCDGRLTATVAGGQSPYTYNWSNNQHARIDSNLCIGMYRVSVTDSFGCSVVDSSAITQPALLTVSTVAINDSCHGQCNGSIRATAAGGTAPYTYTWTGGNTGPLDSNLCAGSYSVTVKDALKCSAVTSYTVTEPATLNIVIASTRNDSCNGQCNGRIATTTTGGTPPYTYTWTGGGSQGNNGVDSNLCVGPYSVVVKDAMGCTATANANITEPPVLVLNQVSVTNVSCFGGNTGQIVVNASGGTPFASPPPYFYAIDFPPFVPQPTGTFSGLAAGTHLVGTADSHQCTATLSIVVTQPPLLTADTVSTTQVSCFGGNNGQIIVEVAGGTTPYTYVWPGVTPTNSDSIADNLTANTYTANITDAKGCTASVTATITQPAVLNATVTTDSVSCNSLCDGKVFITATGGIGPYQFQLDASGIYQLPDSFTTLCAGAHTVTVQDANLCTKTVNFTIYEPLLLTATAAHRDASCHGVCDGMVRLTALGGTRSYSYSIDGLVYNTIDSFNGLCAGNYNFTILDHRGCQVLVNDVISEPTAVVLTLNSQTDPTCFNGTNGQIDVTATDGTPGYLYAVDNPTNQQATGLFTGLAAGPHTVGAGDTHGCIATINVILGQPTQLVADTLSTTQVSCNGGSDGTISLTVSGGTPIYSYAWPLSPGTVGPNATGLAANTYTANITDANGCTTSVTATITQPTLLTATVLVDSITCFGLCDGKVFITPAGGTGPYQFQIDASGTYQSPDSFTDLCLGSHTVTVQDANLCTTNVTFNVDQPTQLFASIAGFRDAICFNQCSGFVRASGTGGTLPYSYSIDGFTYFLVDSFNGVCPGTYTMTILDVHGCAATAPFTIGNPAPVVLAPVDSTAPRCFNGNDGQYTVVGSGGSGSGYQYSGDGGTTYQTNPHFAGQTPGTHLVTVKDGNGCTGTYTITVPNAPPNDTYSTVITNVTCNGGSDGSITASINGGGTIPPYTYAWSFNGVPNGQSTPALLNIPAGSYVPVIYDGNQCQVYGPADSVVTQPTPITDVYTVTPTKCYGSSDGCISVTPSGGTPPYTHSWSNGVVTASACTFAIGAYTDTIRDANGCIHIDNTIVMTQPTPVVEILTPTPVSCPGDSDGTISVAPSGGTGTYTYNWSPISSSAQNVSGLPIGTYTVTVTDANLCTSTATADILAANPMVLNAQKKNVLCPPLKNGFIYLPITGGVPAYNFSWDNGSVSDYLPALAEGTYNVTITDGNGCEIDTSFVVGNDSSFVIRVTPDTLTIPQGESVIFGVDITGGTLAHISWDPAVNLTCSDCTTPVGTPMHTVEYTVHGVSDSGCVSDTRSLITVIPQHQLFVPNTFTPNNDGINDTWEIYGNKKSWLFVEVNVFDRWGEKVFESNDINFAWDGTFKGTLMEPNVYVYVLKVTFVDDYTTSNKGTVTILR